MDHQPFEVSSLPRAFSSKDTARCFSSTFTREAKRVYIEKLTRFTENVKVDFTEEPQVKLLQSMRRRPFRLTDLNDDPKRRKRTKRPDRDDPATFASWASIAEALDRLDGRAALAGLASNRTDQAPEV